MIAWLDPIFMLQEVGDYEHCVEKSAIKYLSQIWSTKLYYILQYN
jgi:hypothetical protein